MASQDQCWNPDLELLSRGELEALQLRRLRETLERCAGSPFYREWFREAGFDPGQVRSLEDIRRLPCMDKNTLRGGDPTRFLTVPLDDVVRMHSSSGTTGQATVIFHTAADIDAWTDLVARCMYMTGVRRSDVFQNMMGYGLFTGGLGFHYAAERIGAMVIPAGSGNSKRQIQLMRDFHTTVVHIIPSYALYLLEVFWEMGLDPRSDTDLRIAFMGAEPHSEGLRRRVEEAYGIDAFNSYGLSEMCGPGVAFECPAKQGMHVWEDSFLLEVLDPETLEPVEEGAEGELVFTSLNREGMPLLRYRTRDLASTYAGDCPCGRVHRRISRIKGRTDDMFIVKGVNIFPLQVEKVLLGVLGVGSNYQIVLDTVGAMDEMRVLVEVSGELWHGEVRELNRLRKRLVEELRQEVLITPLVELVEPGSLPAGEGKAVRVLDKRESARGGMSLAKQINVFAQNQPGRLERLTEVLLEEGINIRAITIAGADEYGVIKLLVDDPSRAHAALQREGFSAFMKEVIAVVMDDRPGGLHRVCRVLGESGVNIEDAYGFVFQDRKTAILVVEVEKIPEAEEIMRAKGLELLSDSELYSL